MQTTFASRFLFSARARARANLDNGRAVDEFPNIIIRKTAESTPRNIRAVGFYFSPSDSSTTVSSATHPVEFITVAVRTYVYARNGFKQPRAKGGRFFAFGFYPADERRCSGTGQRTTANNNNNNRVTVT